jgi:methionyl aminopeptidase
VVHGIPGDRVLADGDLVSIDVGVEKNGYYADACETFAVGAISPAAARLMDVTRQSLAAGIAQARPGGRLGDISHAVQVFVKAHGYTVVRELVGHGIGWALHEEPQVPNFGPPGKGPELVPGLVIAIEPMVNEGREAVRTLADDWTVVTADGKLSAHFEHTVAITADGPLILTA